MRNPTHPTIGVTFFLRKSDASIWTNGAAQNCVFLLRLLQHSGRVGRVIAINAGEDVPDAPKAMMLGGLGIEFKRLEEVIDDLDVLVEAGAQVSAANVARVRANGGKAVAYRFGNAFVIDAERTIHGLPSGSIFNGSRFDEVWTNPQHVATCAAYWETCYRAPVRVLPHIWEPLFLERAVSEFPADLSWGYRPAPGGKRVAIFEPNIDIVKTCVIPMLVCEEAHRRCRGALSAVFVTNAKQVVAREYQQVNRDKPEHAPLFMLTRKTELMQHETFRHFAGNLDIVKDGLASFEHRYNTPWFLAKHADVVVSHQWENGLNYAYYDALHGGYPLIHNSPLLPLGVGYRYDGFDTRDGARALLEAVTHHDANADDYTERAQHFLDSVHALAPQNIQAHEAALERLTAQEQSAA